MKDLTILRIMAILMALGIFFFLFCLFDDFDWFLNQTRTKTVGWAALSSGAIFIILAAIVLLKYPIAPEENYSTPATEVVEVSTTIGFSMAAIALLMILSFTDIVILMAMVFLGFSFGISGVIANALDISCGKTLLPCAIRVLIISTAIIATALV